MGVDNPRAVIAKEAVALRRKRVLLHARLQDPASGGTTDAVHTVIALKTGLPQSVLSLHLFADRGDRGPDGDDGKQPAIARSGKCLSHLLPLLALMQAGFLSRPAQPQGEGIIKDVMLD